MAAQRPADEGLAEDAEALQPVLFGKSHETAGRVHLLVDGAAQAEHPAADVAQRERRRVRMLQFVDGLQRLVADP